MGKRLQTADEHITDVRITTATVDIQVMRIGTKQMTLAVFRQLPYRDIFAESGDLMGFPWGWVNYDRGEIHNGDQAKPFVFSYEGVLYRCDLYMRAQRSLKVHPQRYTQRVEGHMSDDRREWISAHDEWRMTGCWVIAPSGYEFARIGPTFNSEENANIYLENRVNGLKILEAAPQLFIGV